MTVPTNYVLMGKGTDPTSGEPMAFVACEHLNPESRVTVYRLHKRASNGSWYNMGQWVSLGFYRITPEPSGRKLSDSQMDQMLIQHAEESL